MGNSGPEEEDAAGGVGGEVRGVGGDEGLGERTALGDVADFAERGVEAKLLGGLEGVVVLHEQAVGAGAIAHVHLRAKIAAQGDENVEDALVADGPGSDAGEEEEGGESGAEENVRDPTHAMKPHGWGTRIAECWEENPEAADGEEDEEGGVGEGDESPEEAEEEPAARFGRWSGMKQVPPLRYGMTTRRAEVGCRCLSCGGRGRG